jgi:hypothetical protein
MRKVRLILKLSLIAVVLLPLLLISNIAIAQSINVSPSSFGRGCFVYFIIDGIDTHFQQESTAINISPQGLVVEQWVYSSTSLQCSKPSSTPYSEPSIMGL